MSIAVLDMVGGLEITYGVPGKESEFVSFCHTIDRSTEMTMGPSYTPSYMPVWMHGRHFVKSTAGES